MIDWVKIYKLLDEITPLKQNCGDLCNAVCCTEWDKGVGMYLLPGEDVMFTGEEDWLEWEEHSTEVYEFCPTWFGNIKFLRCKGYCLRERRPLACRVFPLMPYLTEDGKLTLRFDIELGSRICPLAQNNDINILDPEFVRRVAKVYQILLDDKLIRDDIEWQSRQLDLEYNVRPEELPNSISFW
ncbi:hypothetical protein JCM14036_29570 [Desulfotomaculum defluvii]